MYVVLTVPRWGGLGSDALIYYRAAAAWAHGTNPWSAGVLSADGNTTFHFYGLPPTVLLLQPFTWLPEAWVPAFGMAIEAIAALYVIRRLQLPTWWLLFPPIVSGVLAGNPSIVLLAALVTRNKIVHALAPTLKVYAGLPLLGERAWTSVALAGALAAVSVAVAPSLWGQFLDGSAARAAQLMRESSGGFSAYQFGWLPEAITALALFALALMSLRAAGWLAPIALWPASQFHWNTLVLPLRNPWLAAAFAAHIQGVPPVVVIAYTVYLMWVRLTPGSFRRGFGISSLQSR